MLKSLLVLKSCLDVCLESLFKSSQRGTVGLGEFLAVKCKGRRDGPFGQPVEDALGVSMAQCRQLRAAKLPSHHRGPSAEGAEGCSCSPDVLRSPVSESSHRQQEMWLPALSKHTHQALSGVER